MTKAHSSFSMEKFMKGRDPASATKAPSSFRIASGETSSDKRFTSMDDPDINEVPITKLNIDRDQFAKPDFNSLPGGFRLNEMMTRLRHPDSADGPNSVPETVVFFGGAGDGATISDSGVVAPYAFEIQRRHPNSNILYFDHGPEGLENALSYLRENVSPGQKILTIGHSLGAPRAMQLAAALNRPNDVSLVTVDPEGWGVSGPSPHDIMRNAQKSTSYWANVNGTDADPLDRSNLIAFLGNHWGDGPAAFATDHLRMNISHGEFGKMLNFGKSNWEE